MGASDGSCNNGRFVPPRFAQVASTGTLFNLLAFVFHHYVLDLQKEVSLRGIEEPAKG